jgi:hypothetical protein
MDDHVAVALARRSASPGGRRGHAMRSLRRPYCLFQEHDEQSGFYGRGAEGNNRDGSQTMRVNARLAAAQVGSSDAQAHGAAFFFRGPSEQCGTGRVGGRGAFNFRPPALNAPLCPASEPLARAGLFSGYEWREQGPPASSQCSPRPSGLSTSPGGAPLSRGAQLCD